MEKDEREQLCKYVMEKADMQYSDDFPIGHIEIWIHEFFDKKEKNEKTNTTT